MPTLSNSPRPDSQAGFDCKRCGHCCEGNGGIIVSDTDLARLCSHLGLARRDFAPRFGETRDGKLQVRAENGLCIFFKTGKGCCVHEAKPDICRAWPYFRGNLVDAGSFELARDFCPGIPAAQTHAEFVHEGLGRLCAENLVREHGPDRAGALDITDLMENLAQNNGKR